MACSRSHRGPASLEVGGRSQGGKGHWDRGAGYSGPVRGFDVILQVRVPAAGDVR